MTQAAVGGWDLTELSCDDAGSAAVSTGDAETGKATFRLDPGETVTCTYTNTRQVGTIEIEKQTDPAGGTGFGFSGSDLPGTGNDTFSLDDDGLKTISDTPTGTYHVSEDAKDGWSLTDITCIDPDGGSTDSGSVATIDVDAGETVHCTYTDTEDATVTYEKKTDPDPDPQDFDFTTTGPGLNGATLDTDPGSAGTPASHTDTLSASQLGSHSITEAAQAGWALSDITCVGTTAAANGSTVSFEVKAGDAILCTYTNTRQVGTIQLKKVWQGTIGEVALHVGSTDGGSEVATKDLTGTAKGNGQTDPKTVGAGDYYVSESPDLSASYNASLTCLNTSSEPGSERAGGRTREGPRGLRRGGRVYLHEHPAGVDHDREDAVPGTAATDFEFDPSDGLNAPLALPSDHFWLDDDGDNANALSNARSFMGLTPGTYSVSEVNIASGWKLTGISCAGQTSGITKASSKVTIVLATGANVTCTFIDSRQALSTGAKHDRVLAEQERSGHHQRRGLDGGVCNSGTWLRRTRPSRT